MYSGTIIEELIAMVARAEQRAYLNDTMPPELPAWMTEDVLSAELAGVA
jgi:hypothetical protein